VIDMKKKNFNKLTLRDKLEYLRHRENLPVLALLPFVNTVLVLFLFATAIMFPYLETASRERAATMFIEMSKGARLMLIFLFVSLGYNLYVFYSYANKLVELKKNTEQRRF